MLGVVEEDSDEEASGSILSLCNGTLACASGIQEHLQSGNGDTKFDLVEQKEFLNLWVEQTLLALRQCRERFQSMPATLQKANALTGAVQGMQLAAAELPIPQSGKQGSSGKIKSVKLQTLCGCFTRPRTAPMNASGGTSGGPKLVIAIENLQTTMDLIRVVEGAGEERYIFANWLPGLNAPFDPFYKRPVAFDTVTTYLLASKLPSRLLIHGPSGNGKTSLLKEIQNALSNQDHPLHEQLSTRFSGGLKWMDCGYALRTGSSTFATDIKQRAIALAQDLLPQEDDQLGQMDLANLAAVIKEQLTNQPFIVVFDNVWDGSLFRRDCLNVVPEDRPGSNSQGIILVTSQFNLSSICQWHSPETITIPLSAESNTSACISLLASLWSGEPEREELPPHLENFGRRLVRECNGSPLAIKLLTPLLESSPKERRWKELLSDLSGLVQTLTFKLDSTGLEAGSGTALPRVLYAFQLRARALPRAMRQLLSVFGLFTPGAPIPVAAVLHIFAQVYKRTLEEAALLLRGLAAACYVQVQAPLGRLFSGTVSYHGLLKHFLVSMSDYGAIQLPGTANESTMLCLAMVVLYASTSFQQQALQVFSKLHQEADSKSWEQPPRNRRNPFLEPFWLQLLSLTGDSELGPAARVPVISAARRVASLAEVSESLIVLFADSKTLLAGAGVFSELAWQIEDRSFLRLVASQLEKIRAVSRLIMRLRELTALEGSMAQAEELAVLAWALADLSEFLDNASRMKLRSEPMIPLLQTRYQGAAIYAHQRLLENLGL